MTIKTGGFEFVLGVFMAEYPDGNAHSVEVMVHRKLSDGRQELVRVSHVADYFESEDRAVLLGTDGEQLVLGPKALAEAYRWGKVKMAEEAAALCVQSIEDARRFIEETERRLEQAAAKAPLSPTGQAREDPRREVLDRFLGEPMTLEGPAVAGQPPQA